MSWRFARTPSWIVRHVAVAALVGSMLILGVWQLRRLDDRRAHNAVVAARLQAATVDVGAIVEADAAVDSGAVARVAYRPVRARGRYVEADTVIVENHTYAGRSGAWVLTPLRLADGTAVVVNRGFIDVNEAGVLIAPVAPAGVVVVGGMLLPTERRGSFGPTDPPDGTLDVLARVDLERLQAQLDYDLLPVYVQLATSAPPEPPVAAGEPALQPLPAPELDEGPHFAYAVQWFIFTTIAAGGYGLLLRRVARDRAREEAATASVAAAAAAAAARH